MRRFLCGFAVVLLSSCGKAPAPQPASVPPPPSQAVKDQLLSLHPNWRAVSAYREDLDSFRLYGYLVSGSDIRPPKSLETSAALSKSPEAINRNLEAGMPELSESKWRSSVYLRALYGNETKKEPGWHGRVLVRGGCIFFGDKEMLEQIDKDLR